MKCSDAAINALKEFEGLRLEPYLCPARIPTIGYGHTRTTRMDMPAITEQQAEALLRSDLERFEKAVDDAVTVPLNQNEFDALVLFCYNIGVSAFRTSTLLRLLNDGDREGAANEFPRWNKAKKVVLPGLVARRREEQQLFLGKEVVA